MKSTHFLLLLSLTATFSCREKDEPVTPEPEDPSFEIQIPVKFGEELSQSTKVSIDGISYKWTSGDKFGIFAGSDNVNAVFSLTEGAGSDQAVISGRVNEFSNKTLYAIYPYAEDMTDISDWPVTLQGQVYDGNYTKSFNSTNIREQFYMAAAKKSSNADKTSGWSSSSKLNFYAFAGLVRFDLTSSMSRNIVVDEIYLSTGGRYKLMEMNSIDLEDGSFSGYYSDKLGVSLPYGGTGSLTLKSGEPDTHKYVNMVVAESFFTKDDMNMDIVVCGTIDGDRARIICPKTVNSSMDFEMGKLSELTVPLTDALSTTYSKVLKVTAKGDCLTSPVFEVTDSYEPGKTFWGDDSGESFLSAHKHEYSASGTHTASFDCWGECNEITFETLENVTAIDFSKF